MFCTSCGNELEGDVKFCTKCGTPIKQTGHITGITQEKKKKQEENTKMAWYNIVILYTGVPIMIGAFFDVPFIPTFLIIDGIFLIISIILIWSEKAKKESLKDNSSADMADTASTEDVGEDVQTAMANRERARYFPGQKGNKNHDKRDNIIVAIILLMITLALFWATFH